MVVTRRRPSSTSCFPWFTPCLGRSCSRCTSSSEPGMAVVFRRSRSLQRLPLTLRFGCCTRQSTAGQCSLAPRGAPATLSGVLRLLPRPRWILLGLTSRLSERSWRPSQPSSKPLGLPPTQHLPRRTTTAWRLPRNSCGPWGGRLSSKAASRPSSPRRLGRCVIASRHATSVAGRMLATSLGTAPTTTSRTLSGICPLPHRRQPLPLWQLRRQIWL
mmetsp:Transcript_28663/g.44896  ORF Transcript_28663/g.44896 Transcript_28663/m.44896 type:complete len:216 (+) Transcript_28663:140-787(+)